MIPATLAPLGERGTGLRWLGIEAGRPHSPVRLVRKEPEEAVPPPADADGWTTSSFCSSAACVAVNVQPERVYVRDTKSHNGPVLAFTHEEWAEFVAGVKVGQFALPQVALPSTA